MASSAPKNLHEVLSPLALKRRKMWAAESSFAIRPAQNHPTRQHLFSLHRPARKSLRSNLRRDNRSNFPPPPGELDQKADRHQQNEPPLWQDGH